jgi:hypothetical protein
MTEVVSYELVGLTVQLSIFGKHDYYPIGQLVHLRVQVRVSIDKKGLPIVNLEPAERPSNF